MIILLFILMMADYLLTYWGIHIGFVSEGNGLMRWLMELPFVYGFLAKIIMSGLLLFPVLLARNHRKKIYKYALYIIFAAYGITFALHGYWVCLYLQLVL
jgi:hypothetical protein